MNRTERLYRIEQLLANRRIVPIQTFLDTLEISPATFKRDIEYLRDRLNAPIVWDRDARGYRFENGGAGRKYELPGLWFNASEIHALLTMQQLLRELEPGVLAPHVEALQARLQGIVERDGLPAAMVEDRIRVQRIAARTMESKHFAPVANAVLGRKRLAITHYNRARDESIVREVSPQRLTYYRENWYLAAWCHLRGGLRSFAFDAIRATQVLETPADEVDAAALDALLESGYGIFAGAEVEWARLIFSPERARWVAAERWHPQQRQEWLSDGRLQLEVPFADPRELAMDILRHVPEVEVAAPASLRERVAAQLRAGLARFEGMPA
jgi:predicted DNA-binding transcriptional regulator YafY